MGFLKRSAAGEYSMQDVIAVMTAPLDYGVDIKVVKSSMALQSKATMQATLQELGRGPLSQRLAQDAKVLDKYLKYFDAETFRDSSAPHRDRAQRENEAFLDMLRLGPHTEGLKRPIVLFEDDDALHEAEHDEFIVQNFDELRNHPWLLETIYAHKEQHRIQRQEKEGAVMPGTSQQIGGMMAQSSSIAKPTLTTIAYATEQKRMQEEAAGAQPQPAQPAGEAGGGPSPPGPPQPQQQGGGSQERQPKPAGQPGPRPMNAQAPSSQSPSGRRQNPGMQGGMR